MAALIILIVEWGVECEALQQYAKQQAAARMQATL
jgi:hypothetical protein